MTAPERIWIGCADADNERQVWVDPDEGGTEYTRSDLCNRDAIRAEAFEEAAKLIEDHLTSAGCPVDNLYSAAIRAKAKRDLALSEHTRLSGGLLRKPPKVGTVSQAMNDLAQRNAKAEGGNGT